MALQPGPGGPSSNRLRAAAPSDGTKPKATTTVKQAAAPSIDWNAYAKQAFAPVDYAGLAKLASGRAASETNQLVSGYTGLQQSALEQASQLAAQQNQFGLGASKYLQSLDLPGLTEQGYANAAAAQRAAAAGYSGGLQQTVTDAADAVQRNLAAIGSPQTALNQGQAAGNALYGLGGQLPAESLAATGLAVAGGLRTLPSQAIGYGQTLAAERLGAGQTEAAKYNVSIAEARAQQGALAGDYLDKLSKAAQDAGQDRIANYYKMLSIKQKQDAATTAGHQIDASASKLLGHIIFKDGTEPTDKKGNVIPVTATGAATKPYRYQDSYGRQIQLDPTTGKQTVLSEGQWTDSAGITYRVGLNGKQTPITGPRPVTPQAPHTTVVSDASGQWLIDDATGARITKVGGPSSSTSTGTSYQDAYGRQVHVSPDGTQRVISSGKFTDPATQKVYTVGINGKMTPLTKGKPTKPTAYKVPQGILTKATEMAELALGTSTASNPITGALVGGGVAERKPYNQTLKRVKAYLLGAGVPAKIAAVRAKAIMDSVGYGPDYEAGIAAGTLAGPAFPG